MTTTPAIRVTQYRIEQGEFTGLSYSLKLNRTLAPNYFVMIAGTVQDNGGLVGPDLTSIRVVSDPFSTGDLASGRPDEIDFQREASGKDWQGVITVVECERDPNRNGFYLRDVVVIQRPAPGASGLDSIAFPLRVPFIDADQGVFIGGFRGGGASTPASLNTQHPSVAAAISHDGSELTIERYDGTGSNVGEATFTVYQIEWGSEWNVQRVNATGNNSGQGFSSLHWNRATIDQVTRSQTWIFGTAWTLNDRPQNSAANLCIALGNGAVENSTETEVAANYRSAPGSSSARLLVMSHPNLVVDWQQQNGGTSTLWTIDWTVPAPIELEEHLPSPQSDGRKLSITTGRRLANVWFNGAGPAASDFPITFWSGRHVSDVILQTRRSYGLTGDWSVRLQSIDFGAVAVEAEELFPGSLPQPSTERPESTTALVYIPNHKDLAVADLPLARRTPRTSAFARALAEGAQTMEDEHFALLVDMDFNTAVGANLERWGQLVDEPRGGLSDEDYRRFIEARIAANRSGGSTEEIIRIWKLVVAPFEDVQELSIYPAHIFLSVVRQAEMSDAVVRRVKQMMDRAKPSGISLTLVEATTGYLGFEENPEAAPLDDGILARVL